MGRNPIQELHDWDEARHSYVPPHAALDTRLSTAHLRVLILMGRVNTRQGWCKCTQSEVSKLLGISRQSVNTSIKDLVDFGYLAKQSKTETKSAVCYYRVLNDRGMTPDELSLTLDNPARETLSSTADNPDKPTRQPCKPKPTTPSSGVIKNARATRSIRSKDHCAPERAKASNDDLKSEVVTLTRGSPAWTSWQNHLLEQAPAIADRMSKAFCIDVPTQHPRSVSDRPIKIHIGNAVRPRAEAAE